MSVRVANSRFIDFSLIKYHQLLSGVSNVVELGKRLTPITETAQMMRQTNTVREYGSILSNLPVKEYQLIGQYYLGWLACYNGRPVSPSLFENIFEQSRTYKAKALITLGGLAAAEGKFEDELRHQTEALKYSDLPTKIRTLCGIAVVKAKEGFHKQSLKELESLLPYIRYAGPYAYCQYLNSLAVELAEVGRIEEAANISRIVLASPYAFAYPEWRETGDDIALRGYKSRSVISFRQLKPDTPKPEPEQPKPENLLRLPERERSESIRQSPFFQPSDVTQMAEWKKKMGKEPNGENDNNENLDDMSDKDIFFEIMNLTSEDSITREQLEEILDSVRKITSKKP